ncbi:hypothetical protein Q9R08_05015 [Microbacterium sp. QXD-8]|uniref:Molecular chaperone DnaJ n=1 Tax=Microbacterium psychrotolerans TaxID=3068321 RepID=A0ABU0YYC4_9MICO|nr:hypothetical protein [Microbacterium sp. QXD-8]MDQ7877333.1 hypothetical protein [Microbacterium sp. QXD-8]
MSGWPDTMKVAPIREWPGKFTRERRSSPFRGTREVNGKRRSGVEVTLTQTLADLDRELRELRAKDAELLVAISAEKFRLDGKPRAGATPDHPGVILSFEIPNVGRVSYPCDTFTSWEANLRAIALALEALRKVDRYGVTKRGEQYRGFLALEATSVPAGFEDVLDAKVFLARVTGIPYMDRPLRELVRTAQRKTHPDTGGDAATFQRVVQAEALLRGEGLL